MTKRDEQQLSFDFPPMVEKQQPVILECPIETPQPASVPVPVYSLTEHRATKIARESESHYSAILKLLAHLK